jgi:hypothetical protein
MFFQILNEVTNQINREYPGKQHDHLFHAIKIWCEKLDLKEDESEYLKYISDYYCKSSKINRLINYLDEEWKYNLLRRSKLYDLEVWDVIKGKNENIKFVVLIAFAITAIGYFIYKLNKPKQQQTTRREEPEKSNSNPLDSSIYTVQTPPIPTPTVQKITKQFLVLVVSHAQAGFLESLKAKRRIDFKDGESLYEVTKYLWLGDETEYSKIEPNIGKYSVAKGAESEYDIYLVYIELNQSDEGFNSNVDQLDRYDAFRKLADLSVNLTISPRLQMEAYENIGVYNR